MEHLRKFWRRSGHYYRKGEEVKEEEEEEELPRLGINPGPNVHQDYKDLEEVLGEGDFQAVRVATRRDNLKSVVRVVRRANLEEHNLKRLRREARLLHKLTSPHIIKLHGWYEEPEAVYTAVEFCQGGELLECTAEKEAYSEQEARDLIRALLLGVRHLHEHGICLRNLQPQHLQLSDEQNGVLKIADVKFAVNYHNRRETNVDLLSDKSPFPEFIAPEIIRHKPCGPEADMWSVGVITYILVGGYIPFKGKDKVDLLEKIRMGKFVFEQDRWGSISSDVQHLIKGMLKRKPEARITADEALKSTWLSLSDQLLASKSLNKSLSRLRIFNAKRRLRQLVICVVFVLYGLSDECMDQDTRRTRVVAESGYCVGDSGLCLERRDIMPATRAFSCPLQTSPRLHSLFDKVRLGAQDGSRGNSVQDKFRALALANLTDETDSVTTSADGSVYIPDESPRRAIAVGKSRAVPDAKAGCPSSGPPRGRVRWTETLSSEYRVFDSKEYGVRLTVQGGAPPIPNPAGPVDLEHTARLETCDSKSYLLCTVVHCGPERAQFSPPLMLDFFVQYDEDMNGSIHSMSDNKFSIDEDDDILIDHQVLCRKGHGSWEVMPREKLSVVHLPVGGNETATFIRAKIHHFCSFSLSREVTENDRYKQGHQRNRRTIVVRNTCDMKFWVVMVPTTAVAEADNSREITVKMSFAGYGIEGSAAESSRSKIITLPAGCQPCARPVLKGERTDLDLDTKDASALLILCTLRDVPVEQVGGGTSGLASSTTTPRSVTPTSDVTRERLRKLEFWESIKAYGGRDITILPSFIEGEVQAEQLIVGGGSDTLTHYALALEGSYSRPGPPSPAEASHDDQRHGFRAALKSIARNIL